MEPDTSALRWQLYLELHNLHMKFRDKVLGRHELPENESKWLNELRANTGEDSLLSREKFRIGGRTIRLVGDSANYWAYRCYDCRLTVPVMLGCKGEGPFVEMPRVSQEARAMAAADYLCAPVWEHLDMGNGMYDKFPRAEAEMLRWGAAKWRCPPQKVALTEGAVHTYAEENGVEVIWSFLYLDDAINFRVFRENPQSIPVYNAGWSDVHGYHHRSQTSEQLYHMASFAGFAAQRAEKEGRNVPLLLEDIGRFSSEGGNSGDYPFPERVVSAYCRRNDILPLAGVMQGHLCRNATQSE
jgi:hypothetical protein